VSAKKILIFLVPLLFIVLILAGGFIWFKQSLTPPVAGSAPETPFVITEGESAAAIISDLAGKSLLKSSLAAKIYLKISSLGGRLRPGEYSLSQALSAPEIFKILASGPADIRVTIPEGWRREQIAARLDSLLVGPLKKFSARDFITQTASLEGRLFPDTYRLSPDITTDGVIDLFTANFTKKTGLNPDLTTDRQTVILASLVEREAKSAADRAGIASVLKNRLTAGWPLQIDATVQYAVDNRLCASDLLNCNWWHNPIDTKYPSSYNTYLETGLPPGPICNPGQATVEAVKNASPSAYMYYITGTDGITRYAKTLPEHNLNIDKYLIH
jgi:UPF0755 protein